MVVSMNQGSFSIGVPINVAKASDSSKLLSELDVLLFCFSGSNDLF